MRHAILALTILFLVLPVVSAITISPNKIDYLTGIYSEDVHFNEISPTVPSTEQSQIVEPIHLSVDNVSVTLEKYPLIVYPGSTVDLRIRDIETVNSSFATDLEHPRIYFNGVDVTKLGRISGKGELRIQGTVPPTKNGEPIKLIWFSDAGDLENGFFTAYVESQTFRVAKAKLYEAYLKYREKNLPVVKEKARESLISAMNDFNGRRYQESIVQSEAAIIILENGSKWWSDGFQTGAAEAGVVSFILTAIVAYLLIRRTGLLKIRKLIDIYFKAKVEGGMIPRRIELGLLNSFRYDKRYPKEGGSPGLFQVFYHNKKVALRYMDKIIQELEGAMEVPKAKETESRSILRIFRRKG